jgi:hypothetical protein
MSGGITLGGVASAAAAAASVATAVSALTKKEPKAPEAPKLEAPPQQQAAKAADPNTMRKTNAAAYGAAGEGGTMLTGLDGVSSGGLNLGKNTLLGA